MPCYLRNKAFDRALVASVSKEAQRQGKKLPTKAITKDVLRMALAEGKITPAKYHKLIEIVDACVEEKGHTHDHEHVHETVMA